jgi:hypothetical protein
MRVSLNGADNVGKSTHLRWLRHGLPSAVNLGTVYRWSAQLTSLRAQEAGNYSRWWFEESSTEEHVEAVFSGLAARRAATPGLALEDRGHPMLVAACAATAVVKEGMDPKTALSHVERLSKRFMAGSGANDDDRQLHVLLRHAHDPGTEAALALARESHLYTQWYPRYQRALAGLLDIQARQGGYDAVVVRRERTILDVQRELRELLHRLGLDPRPLPDGEPRSLLLHGHAAAGRLPAPSSTARFRLSDLAQDMAARSGSGDLWTTWEPYETAELVSEELLHRGVRGERVELCLDGDGGDAVAAHLMSIWGRRCRIADEAGASLGPGIRPADHDTRGET